VNTATRVSDPEIDMNRAIDRWAWGSKMSGVVVAALNWLASGPNALTPYASTSLETPRRSVDRQLEQFRDFRWFSSPCE